MGPDALHISSSDSRKVEIFANVVIQLCNKLKRWWGVLWLTMYRFAKWIPCFIEGISPQKTRPPPGQVRSGQVRSDTLIRNLMATTARAHRWWGVLWLTMSQFKSLIFGRKKQFQNHIWQNASSKNFFYHYLLV